MKKGFKFTLIGVFSLIVVLLIIRAILPSQIDDVSPLIPCEESLLETVDVYYVIPAYGDEKISDNLEWCEKISSYDKEIAMHGINHKYKEFGEDISEEKILEGIEIFEECFGFRPERFKAPQLELNKENKLILQSIGFEVDENFNQLFHKVYHCSDTGLLPNWFIRIF